MIKILIRPAIITLMFVIGGCVPALDVLEPVISWSLVVMLYFIALQLNIKEVKFYIEHFYLISANLIFGIAPWLALLLYSPYPLVAKAAFFTSIAPTANAAPVITSFLKGKVPFVVSSFVITNFFITIFLIGLLPLVTGEDNISFIWVVLKNMSFVVGLPIILAILTRLTFKDVSKWSEKCKDISFGAWALALLAIAGKASSFLQNQKDLDLIQVYLIASCSLILCFLHFYVGGKIGRPEFKNEMSQSLGQKNTNFCIFLALTCGGAGDSNAIIALGPTFYVLFHNMWNALQILMQNHKEHLAQKSKF